MQAGSKGGCVTDRLVQNWQKSPVARLYDPGSALALAAFALVLTEPVMAQSADDMDGPNQVVSQPVVQAIPAAEGMTLNAALARLARNPRDVEALIDAGKAALAMGDADAAIGFFQRADQLSPNNSRVKAGLAGAYVRSGDPFTAIPLFEEAERNGAVDIAFIGDRALAYDLVGDNRTAQTYYQQALERGGGDEISRNYALSLAITRDRRGMETVLSPLLQRQDKAAWRIRAFSLAILGQAEEAEAIAYSTMPQDLAAAMTPYLRYMPRLTPAQQAAAADFGHFPRAADIGRDDPRVAAYAQPVAQTAAATPDAGLIPGGRPLGRNDRSSRNARRSGGGNRTAQAQPAAAPPPVPQPTRVEAPAPSTSPPRVAARTPQPRPVPAQPVAPPTPTPTAIVQPAPSPVATPAPLSVQQPPPTPALAQAPVPTPVAAAQPAPAAPPPVIAATVQPTNAVAAPPQRPDATPVTPGFAVLEQPPVANPAPGFDLARVSPAPATASPASPTPAPEPAPPAAVEPRPIDLATIVPAPAPPAAARRPSLAEAFADLATPPAQPEVAIGAVDIRNITPARATTPVRVTRGETTNPAPAAPTHPSRIWVQLATGRDRTALGFDWRRMAREAETTFRGRQPSISAWGQSNRLLAGPFESEAAANAFIAQLRRADVTGMFLWTSPAGQVVDRLPLR